MQRKRTSRRGRIVVALAAGLLSLPCGPDARQLVAATPNSPEVRQIIGRALVYLEKADDERLGAKCLVGLAFIKSGHPDHPKVFEALEACRAIGRQPPASITTRLCDIYSTGLAVIFLCTLDPVANRQEIQTFLSSLELRQKACGGWGYEYGDTGDTSMTQYGALAYWEANASGVPISIDGVARMANWLIRTQDPSGAWGYQGRDPGNYNQLIEQDNPTITRTASALGSLYMAADLLKVRDDDKLPPALKRVAVIGSDTRPMRPTVPVDRTRLNRALRNGIVAFERSYRIDPEQYAHYYLYALERYQSLRELAERRRVPEPRWYNDGVRFLSATQAADGSFNGDTRSEVDTSFSILFLLRSMRGSIERNLGDGMLAGGRGLPSDSSDLVVRNGRVMSRKLVGPAEDLLKLMKKPGQTDLGYIVDHLDHLEVTGVDALAKEEQVQIAGLTRADSPEARLIAIRILRATGEIESVPRLIGALRDPDRRVMREANEALKFIARKLEGFELPAEDDQEGLEKLIEQWRDWYRTIHPDAIF